MDERFVNEGASGREQVRRTSTMPIPGFPHEEPTVSAEVTAQVRAAFGDEPGDPETGESGPDYFHEYVYVLRASGVAIKEPIDLLQKVIPEVRSQETDDQGFANILRINMAHEFKKTMRVNGDEIDFFAVIGENMMEVYAGRRIKDGKLVALRTVHTFMCSDDANFSNLNERALREAHFFEEMDELVVGDKPRDWPEFFGSGQMTHPQVDKSVNYSYLEFIPGITLFEFTNEFPEITVRPEFVLAVAIQVAHALEDLYDKGYVIRDLRPENIMLVRAESGKPFVRLFDANIIHIQGSTLTRPRTAMGSPGTMSPEVSNGFAIDQRSDLYSLGVVMYSMLQKNYPFEYDEVHRVLNAHAVLQPRKIDNIPDSLWNLVSAFLKKDPKDRVQSGAHARRLLVDYYLSNYHDSELTDLIGPALNLEE